MNVINKVSEVISLEKFIPYLENTGYLVIFLIFMTILIYFLLNFLFKIFLVTRLPKLKERNLLLTRLLIVIV